MILRTEAVGMFLMPRGYFLIEIPEELLTIRELRVVAEATLLLKGLSSWTKLLQIGENLCANAASQVGPFFTVLTITLSFLVRFRPVKY